MQDINAQDKFTMTPDKLYDALNVVKKDAFYICTNIPGTSAATSGNYGVMLVARYPIEVLMITERHEVLGTDGGAVSLDVMNVPNGTAIASGNSMLITAFDLKATINTNVIKQGPTTLNTYRVLEQGAAIALKTTGTLTSVAGVHVTIYFKNLGRGDYR